MGARGEKMKVSTLTSIIIALHHPLFYFFFCCIDLVGVVNFKLFLIATFSYSKKCSFVLDVRFLALITCYVYSPKEFFCKCYNHIKLEKTAIKTLNFQIKAKKILNLCLNYKIFV